MKTLKQRNNNPNYDPANPDSVIDSKAIIRTLPNGPEPDHSLD